MSTRRGFSLLEMMLALALVAMLSGGIFGFLWNLMDRRDRLLAMTAEAQSAGALFELLEADISCAIAGDPVRGAGISGDSQSLRVLSRRVWAPVSLAERPAAAGDLQRSEYTFDGGEGVIRLRRQPEPSPAGTSGSSDVLGRRVQAVRFRYFDGRMWVNEFDTLKRTDLPVAIELAVWFGAPAPAGADGDAAEVPEVPQRSPDRLRIIAVADGPTTTWKEMR
jgi:prepilin-type N-terminal cleavage/methylation domain-containing protein